MDRFQLATLARWAGERGVQGRKRLQKVVYLLQAAGCPLNAEFSLHHYGPYSWDVANVSDEMASAGLLTEQKVPNVAGVQYTYTLPQQTAELLARSERNHPDRVAELAPFSSLASELLDEDLWPLELGSTILYFYQHTKDWSEATRKACEFKKVPADDQASRKAAALAERVLRFQPHPGSRM